VENREAAIPEEDQGKIHAAENISADSWLHVAVDGDFELLNLQVRCLDLINGLTAFELDIEKELLRGTRELGLLLWTEVEEAVGEYFDTALSLENRFGDLIFQALPGTRILGLGPRRFKTDEDGSATTEVALPSTIPFRATKPGYMPIEGQIYMDQTEKVVSLDQKLAARMALDVYLNNMSFPGIDFIYFFIPDAFFARISLLTYLIGFVMDDRGLESESFFVSRSLNNFSLALGFFANDPDKNFRPYFALGAVWRFITAEGYWGLEPVAPFAAQPILGCEYSQGQKVKLYAEYAPYFYFAPDRGLFSLSVPLDHDIAFIYLPILDNQVDWAWIWEIFVFNVGVRIRL
jgi:hypothetical protein